MSIQDEFKEIMKNLPEHVSDEDIDEMFEFADKDQDGEMTYEEFTLMVKPQKPPVTPKPTLIKS